MSDRILSSRRHKQSGPAIVTLSDGFGNRRDVLLGKYGTAESRKEYARVISEWEATGRRLPPKSSESSAPDLTIAEAPCSITVLSGNQTKQQGPYRPA
jgi:hypothetical protein